MTAAHYLLLSNPLNYPIDLYQKMYALLLVVVSSSYIRVRTTSPVVCEYVWIVYMYDIQTVGSGFDIVIIIAMVMDNPGVASQAFLHSFLYYRSLLDGCTVI